MVTLAEATIYECVCEVCGESWKALAMPPQCRKCRSRKWNGAKQMGRPKKPGEPKPARVRKSVRRRRELPEYADSKW